MSIRAQVSCSLVLLGVLVACPVLRNEIANDANDPRATRAVSDSGRFYAAVGRSFHLPADEVRRFGDRGLTPGQVVVVCFLAERSHQRPTQILADREAGKSWREIAIAAGLGPESFYPAAGEGDAPLVNVYALYRELPRERWNRMPLEDAEIESLVSSSFRAQVEERQWPDVLRLRAKTHDFTNVDHFLLGGQQTAQRREAAPPAGEVLPA